MVDQRNAYFNQVYDATYQKITGFVIAKCSNISDVEDIVQEVYTEFYSTLSKKGIEYICNSEAFIMQITKSKIHKHYTLRERRKGTVPLYDDIGDGDESEHIDEGYEIEDKYVNDITVGEIWRILKKKETVVQKVFALYFYCDKSIREISEELSLSESNVKHKLYRTLEEIRSIYKKEGEAL